MAGKPVGPRRVKTWTIHRPGDPDLRDPTVSHSYQAFVEAWLQARSKKRQPSRRQFALTIPDPVDPTQGWHHGSLKWHLSEKGRRAGDFLVRAEMVVSVFALTMPEKQLLLALAAQDGATERTVHAARDRVALARERLLMTYAQREHFTEVLGKWRHAILLELAGCEGFRADPAWISEHMGPAMSEEDASTALAVLKRLGLLELVDGRWVRARDLNHLSGSFAEAADADPEFKAVAYAALRRPWKPLFETASRLPNEMSGYHRYISSALTPLAFAEFEAFEKEADHLLRDIVVAGDMLAARTEPDMVYQVAVIAMPVATTVDVPPDWFEEFYRGSKPKDTP